MANLFPFMKQKDGENKLRFPLFEEILPKSKFRKPHTDTNIANLKEDLKNVLFGDTDSLKRINEYTLRRKQELKSEGDEGESDSFLQDAEFIHHILAECDLISPQTDLLKQETKPQYGTQKERNEMPRLNITKMERNEMYMLSIIAYDLISLEESQKSPVHMSKVVPGFKDSLSYMQQIIGLPDDTAKALRNQVNESADYGFNIKLKVHRVQGLKGQIEDTTHATELYCRIGCLSKAMVGQKKLDVKSKGIHVHNTSLASDTITPVWNEEFHFPLGYKEDYLLIELWRSKIAQGKKKSAKSLEEFVSRCLLRLDPTMEETVEEDYELTTTSGKETSAVVIMSFKIIANTKELQFISHYNASQKLTLFQNLRCEITYYLDKRGDSLCFGRLTEPFQCFQCKLIEILKLSEFQVRAATFDCPEVWGKSKIMNREDIEKSLDLLKTEWDKVDNMIMTLSQKSHVIKNVITVFDNAIKRLSNILSDFPPVELESKPCVETLIIMILGSYFFLLDRGEIHKRFNIQDEMTKVITEGIRNWYTQKRHSILDKSSPKFRLETLIKLCDCILHLMEGSDMNYREAFFAIKIDYTFLFISTVDTEIAEEINQVSNVILGEDNAEMNKLYFMMFHLYRKLLGMLKRISNSSISKTKLNGLKLNNLEDWFRPFINYWCVVLQEVCMQSIETMIDIEEEGTHEYQGSKVSSSAIDIGLCLLPSYLLFTKLEDWTNRDERFHLALQMIQMNIDALRKYSYIMKDKIMTNLESSQSDPFQVSAELCILLNNNHCVRHYVDEGKAKINIDKLNLGTAYQLTSVDELFNASLENVDTINLECINAIGKKFRIQFATNYERFIATSQGPNIISRDIDDIMNWLLQNVTAAVQYLSSDLFLPMLEEMWTQTLECISEYRCTNKSQSTSEKIYMSLDYLKNFFQNEGEGITNEKVEDTIYYSLVEHFSLYGEESHELMVKFGSEISEFCKRAPDNIGSCAFNVAYMRDKQELEIRIIQVENIPNPGAQTVIYLEANVLPKYGSTATECKTKTRKYEKSIIFDESINLSVPTDSFDKGCVLQINIFYANTFKMGLFPDYGGSVYLASKEIGHMNSTDSVADILKGENEVRRNTKMSFLAEPCEGDILTILRERKNEGAVSNFLDSVTQGVKDEKIKRIFSEGVEETRKFFNKLHVRF